jgi:hypothetical protein
VRVLRRAIRQLLEEEDAEDTEVEMQVRPRSQIWCARVRSLVSCRASAPAGEEELLLKMGERGTFCVGNNLLQRHEDVQRGSSGGWRRAQLAL